MRYYSEVQGRFSFYIKNIEVGELSLEGVIYREIRLPIDHQERSAVIRSARHLKGCALLTSFGPKRVQYLSH